MVNKQQHNDKLPSNAVVCLMAPTASGKTTLAYELYDTGRFEIVSVDSALIYKDMNIGTAKPSEDELSQYPHHLVNIIEPTETYSVATFVKDVKALINEIHNRQKIPLLVGGTMMYYNALFTGLSSVPETDMTIRGEVELWRQQVGIEALHDYLKKVDPVIAERLNPTDSQRVTRAIEVYKQTGKALSEWQTLPKIALADNPEQYWLGLAVMPDRPWLHKRIEQRLQIMWTSGFIEEVIQLLDKYKLSLDTPAMRCVGYRQVLNYLIQINHPIIHKTAIRHENYTQNEHIDSGVDTVRACHDMQNRALYATRQLAKRQYTWLRNLVTMYVEYADLVKYADLTTLRSEYAAYLKVAMYSPVSIHSLLTIHSQNLDSSKISRNKALLEAKAFSNNNKQLSINYLPTDKKILRFTTISDTKRYLYSRL